VVAAVEIRSRAPADGVTSIAVAGDIDMATVDELSDAMHTALRHEDAAHVVLDFAEVTFCDSSGLAALDAAYAEASRRDRALTLINIPPQVRRVLEIVDMLDTLTGRDIADR